MRQVGHLRIAYFAEIFPHLSETWVHHEILALERLGCVVRVFATHARPSEIPEDLKRFIDRTTYLKDLRIPPGVAVCRVFRPRLLVPVLRAMFLDTKGIRQKAQVLRDLIYTGRLITSVREFQPNILFAHFAGTRTNMAMFSSLLSGIPFAFKMHSSDVFNRVALFGLKMKVASAVTTITDYNIRFIEQNYPDVDASVVQRHPCGVPSSVFTPRIGGPHRQKPRLVSVGRLVRPKGFDVLIKASRCLLDRGVAHEIVIVGDGPERSYLEEMIASLRVVGTVRLAGYASPKGVREEVVGADVFVLPCVIDQIVRTHDGLPLALIEAMALGVPVVSTNLSGIPELIESGVTGLLAMPGDVEMLADSIMACLALETEARLAMVKKARHKIEKEYDSEILAAKLLGILVAAAGVQKSSAQGADVARAQNG